MQTHPALSKNKPIKRRFHFPRKAKQHTKTTRSFIAAALPPPIASPKMPHPRPTLFVGL
jgi:hypothetical protein